MRDMTIADAVRTLMRDVAEVKREIVDLKRIIQGESLSGTIDPRSLSEMQLAVCHGVARIGKTQEFAPLLGLKGGTVKNYLCAVYEHCSVKGRVGLTRLIAANPELCAAAENAYERRAGAVGLPETSR